MRAGELDRRITIQNLVLTTNAIGEPEKSFSDLVTSLPAQVKPVRGKEKFQTDRQMSEDVRLFVIRFRTDIEPKQRIVYDSKNFDIESVVELGRRSGLEIFAKAVK